MTEEQFVVIGNLLGLIATLLLLLIGMTVEKGRRFQKAVLVLALIMYMVVALSITEW